MDAKILSKEPTFERLSKEILDLVRKSLPDPINWEQPPVAQLKQLQIKMQNDLAKAVESESRKPINLDPFLQLLRIPEAAFNQTANTVNQLAFELIKIQPDITTLGKKERDKVVLAALTHYPWWILWVADITGLDPEVVAEALDDWLSEQPGPPNADNCEQKCTILYDIKIALLFSALTTASIACAATAIIPPLAFACFGVALASYAIGTAGATKDYKDCVAACVG